MAKKVIHYNCDVKSLSYRYKNLNITTYVVGVGSKYIFLFLPVPHSGVLAVEFFSKLKNKDISLIAFDIPGWFESTYTEALPISEMVNIVKSYSKSQKILSYSIIGIQYGATLAINLAESNEKVKSLILINPIFKKSLQKNKTGTFLKSNIANILLKVYTLFKYYKIYYSKNKVDGFSRSHLNKLKNINYKVVSECIYEYFNSDLSLNLNSLLQPNLLVLNEKKYSNQVEYLKRMVGRDQIESHEIRLQGYPVGLDEISISHIREYISK